MKTKLQWAVLFCLLSIISLLSTGCPTTNNTDAEEEEQLGTGGGPVITAQPMGGFYNAGDAIDPLVIAAESPDNGTLTYQWYKADSPGSNGAEVAGATDATYQPTDTAVGKTFYYCVVTNTSALTQATRKSAVAKIFILAEGSTFSANTTVTVDTTRNQYVRGFGGMYVVWTNFPDLTLQNMRTMFDPDGELGYNMLWIMIPPINTDIDQAMEDIINRVEYSSDTVDNSDYYDMVKYVNSKNGYVLASPWNPPKEWKSGGTINGGESLLPAYYGDYAAYLKKFCQNMFTHGAPLYAISIQNEPNYAAAYNGCDWTNDEMKDFFKQVGHFTTGVPGYGGGKATEYVLTMNGESANNVTINDAALNDTTSRAAIDLIGRHFYGNQQNNYWGGAVVNKEKEVWMTEHNLNSQGATGYPNDSTWNYVWKFMNSVDTSIRLNNESAYIWWALKRFYSMIGDGEHGTVENAILPRGYALAHYARVANETWRVNVTVSGTSNVNRANFEPDRFDGTSAVVTAFESDDQSSISLVMFTPTNPNGTGGVDMGWVKIQLPETFTVGSATAIRSTASAQGQSETVLLDKSKTAMYVQVPPSNIVSVKLTK